MFLIEPRNPIWWCWLATAVLLSIGLAGYAPAFLLAIGLTVLQLLHYLRRDKRLSAFPVQVRLGYLVILLIALPAPMRLLYWLPAMGTWALVLFGYCLLARGFSLLPWNRKVPCSARLIVDTFLARPVRGCLVQPSSAPR
jgi:hypothetical protein